MQHWGKLVGAVGGALCAGPIGSFAGLLGGALFDKHAAFIHSQQQRPESLSLIDANLYRAMGYLGQQKNNPFFRNQVISQLSPSLKQQALHYYDEGAVLNFQFFQYTLNAVAENTQALRERWLQLLKQFCNDTNCLNNETEMLTDISQKLGLALTLQQSPKQHALAVLGLSAAARPDEIKRAYRRLISQHHPDKVIAQNADPEKLRQATLKAQELRQAYEILLH